MPITFISDRPFKVARKQLMKDLRDWGQVSLGDVNNEWRQWAGSHLDVMLTTPIQTLQYLSHSDPLVRLTAVSLTYEYWESLEMFVAPCMELTFNDSDARVRGAAFTAVFYHSHFINDPSGVLFDLFSACFGNFPEQQVLSLYEEARDLRIDVESQIRKECQELAGSSFQRMLEGPEVTHSFLTDEDPKIRRAAIRVMGLCWEKTSEFAEMCEKMMLNDNCEEVRFWALDSLIAYYADTDHARIGNLLASFLYRDDIPLNVRKRAYTGLFSVRGMPLETWPTLVVAQLDLSQDVDWSFVDSFFGDNCLGSA